MAKFPKVGLEAVMEDADFNKGVANYLKGSDKMVDKSQKTGSALGGLGGALTKLGGLIGTAFAVTKVVAGLKAVTAAAVAEQAGIASLGQAVKNTGADWDTASAAIEAYLITEMKRVGLDDGEGRAAIQRLTESTGSYTKALSLMGLTEDLAAAKKMDLATAADLVGKVTAGNLGTLSRYGIVLKEGSTATEALAEMQKRFAGQAEVMGNKTAGAMKKWQVASENLKETLGGGLLPLITPLINLATDLAWRAIPAVEKAMAGLQPLFTRITEAIKQMLAGDVRGGLERLVPPGLANALLTVGDAIGTVIRFVREMEPATWGLVGALGAVGVATSALTTLMSASPIGLIALAVAAAVAAIVVSVDKYNKAITGLATTNAVLGASQATAGVAYTSYAQQVLTATMAVDAATRDAVARWGEEVAIQGLVQRGLIMTRAEYDTLAGTYAKVNTAATGAALASKMLRDEQMFEAQTILTVNTALQAQSVVLGQWGDVQARALASAAEIASAAATAGTVLLEAFSSDALIKQLDAQQQTFAAHGRAMTQLALQNGQAVKDAEFQYQLKRAQAEQLFQQQHVALLAQGKSQDAAELASKFANEQSLAQNQYAVEQQLQQRNYLIQQIQAKRAYILQLQDMRDQTLRVLQEQIKAEGVKRGMSQIAINQALRDIARAGSDTLALETASYIARAQGTADYWKGTVTATGAAVQAIKDIIAGQQTAEGAAAALEAQLSALQSTLLANLPALPPLELPPLDTTALGNSANNVGPALEPATTAVSRVVQDIASAITAAKQAIQDLLGFDVPVGVDAGLGRLADFIKLAVDSMYATLDSIKPQVNETKEVLSPLNELFGVIKTGVDVLKALADYAPVKDLPGQAYRLADDMAKTVTAFRDVFVNWLKTTDLKQDSLDWWAMVSGMIGNVKGGVDAMKALTDYEPVKGLVGKAETLASDMIKTATAFRNVFVGWLKTTNLKQESLDWWAMVTALVANVKGGVDTMKALTDYAPVKNLVAKAETLASDMIKTATALRDVFVEWVGTTNLTQEALDWWAKVGMVVGVVKQGVDAIAALNAYKTTKNLVGKAHSLASDMIKVATELRNVFVGWVGTTNLSQAALDWWNKVKDIVGVVKPGIDALAALSAYKHTQGLDAKVANFAADMAVIADWLNEAFLTWGKGKGGIKLSDAALVWWNKVQSVVAIVKPGIDAIVALTAYKNVTGLPAKMVNFTANIKEIIRGLMLAMNAEGMPTLAEIKVAAKFWGNVTTVMSAVTPASEAINRLIGVGIVPLASLKTKFAAFSANVTYLVTALAGMVTSLKAAGVTRAAKFGEHMTAISDAIAKGLGTLQDVRNQAQGGDPHNAVDALWGFVRSVNEAMAEAVRLVALYLTQIRQAFVVATPGAYAAGYNYGRAIALGIESGLHSVISAGPNNRVFAPAYARGGGGNTYHQTVSLGGINVAGGISNGMDLQRVGDYVVQRVREGMRR